MRGDISISSCRKRDRKAASLQVRFRDGREAGSFGPIAKKVIYVETDAPLNRNYRQIPYARVNRPIWPLDEVTAPGLVI